MEKRLGKEIHIVSNKIDRKMDALLSGFDCTHSQFAILSYILCNSDRDVFQRDLEERFGIRRSSVSATLSNMEDKGYITRSSVSSDARLKKISVGKKGVEIYNQCIDSMNKLEKELSDSVTKEEIAVFYKVLDRLSNVVD